LQNGVPVLAGSPLVDLGVVAESDRMTTAMGSSPSRARSWPTEGCPGTALAFTDEGEWVREVGTCLVTMTCPPTGS